MKSLLVTIVVMLVGFPCWAKKPDQTVHHGMLFSAYWPNPDAHVVDVNGTLCNVTNYSVECGDAPRAPHTYFMLDDGRVFAANGITHDIESHDAGFDINLSGLIDLLNPRFIDYIQLPDKDGHPVIHIAVQGIKVRGYTLDSPCDSLCKDSVVMTTPTFPANKLRVSGLTPTTFTPAP